MNLWKCSVCGYVHEGQEAPDACPKCGALKDKFTVLSSEQADKIYQSDRTNDIHMELVTLSSRIIELCKEGIDLDLDPPCVSMFNKCKKSAWIMKQMAKAEMQGHMNKGKW